MKTVDSFYTSTVRFSKVVNEGSHVLNKVQGGLRHGNKKLDAEVPSNNDSTNFIFSLYALRAKTNKEMADSMTTGEKKWWPLYNLQPIPPPLC